MPIYVYRCRDRSGKLVSGRMEASTEAEIARRLKDVGYHISGISQQRLPLRLPSLFSKLNRIKQHSILMFNIQLSTLIDAGVTLIRSLQVLHNQVESNRFREIIGEIILDLESGSALSEAMEKHPRVFSTMYVSMIAAGEASGELPTILSRLATHMEKQSIFRQKLKSALTYPVILTVLSVIVLLLVVTFVLPNFIKIFTDTGVSIPLPTLILYRLGTAIKSYWHIGIIIMAGLIVLMRYFSRSVRGRLVIDAIKLKLPVFGNLIRKAAVAMFARSLAMLVATGVPIIKALNISVSTFGNAILSKALEEVAKNVEKGKGIAEPLRISGQFPPLMIQMVVTGEETGQLDTLLDKIAGYYEIEVDYAIKRMTALIEPLFLVIMGAITGFIMASTMIPLFRMVNLQFL